MTVVVLVVVGSLPLFTLYYARLGAKSNVVVYSHFFTELNFFVFTTQFFYFFRLFPYRRLSCVCVSSTSSSISIVFCLLLLLLLPPPPIKRYKPWYLEECSSTLATTYSSGTPGHDKSVATVDMDGRLRPDRICTVEHTGTSASAPLAAGICALALEANPTLTWRDLQYLVVLTSNPEPLQKENGWIYNGVRRKVSHKFGYGLMDAGQMVSLAEKWTPVPSQHICRCEYSLTESLATGCRSFVPSSSRWFLFIFIWMGGGGASNSNFPHLHLWPSPTRTSFVCVALL